MAIEQFPEPGDRLLRYKGDLQTFYLRLSFEQDGTAWLRTNLGKGDRRRTEIIAHTENGEPLFSSDWHDKPMQPAGDGLFKITVPLLETGCFQAKAYFLPSGNAEPVWPAGDDVGVTVEPAGTCAQNTLYTAFVRQFGPNKSEAGIENARALDDCNDRLEQAGYTVLPPSGTFRDLVQDLDHIIDRMGFRIIQLLPVFPVPVTYARMGRYGSPFAALDFFSVDPALAVFERQTTPMDQFRELAGAVHRRGAQLFLDVPVNHTGWASRLQLHHPEWFCRTADNHFESPGAWGITWEDLSKLDYSHRGLRRYMAEVFLYWCSQGVDGFRCDAGHMIEPEVWTYIVAKVREQYPDTVFLLEGLGGRAEVNRRLLTEANLNWDYSELFQNYNRGEIESYLVHAAHYCREVGTLIHFAETHDNLRLASTSRAYARLRTALAALCSSNGAFGITNGVEWFAEQKVDVHGAPPLNWGAESNQVAFIARLNQLLRRHPVFHTGGDLRVLPHEGAETVMVLRLTPDGMPGLLVAANLDQEHVCTVVWSEAETPLPSQDPIDQLTDKFVPVERQEAGLSMNLPPAQVRCLDLLEEDNSASMTQPDRVLWQRLRAKALEVAVYLNGEAGMADDDLEKITARLHESPRDFAASFASEQSPPPVTVWRWPIDSRRTVMVPSGNVLCITASAPFLIFLQDANGRILRREYSLQVASGRHETLVCCPYTEESSSELTLAITVFEGDAPRETKSTVVVLGQPGRPCVQRRTRYGACEIEHLYGLATNGTGAMSQVRAAWGRIRSQYDAMLAANLHPAYPVDRHVLLTRCRCWLTYRGYYHELKDDSLAWFGFIDQHTLQWFFHPPAGMGTRITLVVTLQLLPETNHLRLRFHRLSGQNDTRSLDDTSAVNLIVRPDIEDRMNHAKTKAYLGPENDWPAAIKETGGGFHFVPAEDRGLGLTTETPDTFTREDEWRYMIDHPEEAERGLEHTSDLYSPGYFTFSLAAGGTCTLNAWTLGDRQEQAAEQSATSFGTDGASDFGQEHDDVLSVGEAARRAIRHFLVRRNTGNTVIAGYPWFLDWGRDTLICLRGIIAAGWIEQARAVLREFAAFEEGGTLPNMIRGDDASNRDTSDAPLWFSVACEDLVNVEGNYEFLEEDCGGRTVQDVLVSIAEAYCAGTTNGIFVDETSGLVYSPPHFTWMDTNHPAGTPRQGYPVEIQALWYRTLRFLARLETGQGRWAQLAEKVQRSIHRFFLLSGKGYASDCLHGGDRCPAAEAVPDNALRPNQLLLITLADLLDAEWARSILAVCERLLVPGGIRTLDDQEVEPPLPVEIDGRLLNNPVRPYQGAYAGDEDTSRKPAYHNGTAWTWPFPSYAEALWLTYGEPVAEQALSVLESSSRIMNRGCLGQIPEIMDGDAPHKQRGCGAQAWGATELYRVIAKIQGVV